MELSRSAAEAAVFREEEKKKKGGKILERDKRVQRASLSPFFDSKSLQGREKKCLFLSLSEKEPLFDPRGTKKERRRRTRLSNFSRNGRSDH